VVERTRNVLLDCTDADAEPTGNVAVGQAVKPIQREDLTAERGQFAKGAQSSGQFLFGQ